MLHPQPCSVVQEGPRAFGFKAAVTSVTVGLMEALPVMEVPHLEGPEAVMVMRQAIRGQGPPLSKVWTRS